MFTLFRWHIIGVAEKLPGGWDGCIGVWSEHAISHASVSDDVWNFDFAE